MLLPDILQFLTIAIFWACEKKLVNHLYVIEIKRNKEINWKSHEQYAVWKLKLQSTGS